MKVFNNYYKDLRKQRSYISNPDLGETYKRVIEEYNHCIEIEEYLVSFILIQNLLEDRLYVLYKLMDEKKHKDDGLTYDLSMEYYHERVDLRRIIYELSDYGLLTDDLKINLLTSVKLRNRHIHFSFMNMESFDKELSEGFYFLFREVDKIVQKFKKLTQ